MKQQNYSFLGPDVFAKQAEAQYMGNKQRAFDWDKAASIIKERFAEHHDLVAEAGLQGDWEYTGGEIFSNGMATNDSYTYLSSNWATPTLILSYDGEGQEEIECCIEESERFRSGTKWDAISLAILGLPLKPSDD